MASLHPLETHGVKPRRPEPPQRGWAGVSVRDAAMSGAVLTSIVTLALLSASSILSASSTRELSISILIVIGAALIGGTLGVGLKLRH